MATTRPVRPAPGDPAPAPDRSRAALVLGGWVLACGVGSVAVLAWAAPWAVQVVRSPAAAGPGDLLVVLAVAVLAGVLLAWLLGGLLCVLEAALHRALPRAGTPALVHRAQQLLLPVAVRRMAATALGASLVTGVLAPGATAAEVVPTAAVATTTTAAVPAWPSEGEAWQRPAPRASAPPSTPSAPAPAPAPAPSQAAPAGAVAGADPAEVVVRPGDSLWRIAEQHLPPEAPPTAVAAAWPQWWSANRAVVGDDPDLLVPGQVLQVPR